MTSDLDPDLLRRLLRAKDRMDVASYFRALNFREKERVQMGRGGIMVFEQAK